jgi:hypothetical protein
MIPFHGYSHLFNDKEDPAEAGSDDKPGLGRGSIR